MRKRGDAALARQVIAEESDFSNFSVAGHGG
jgi:hypothetical protein